MSVQLIKVEMIGQDYGPQPGARIDVYLSVSAILTVKIAGQMGDVYTILVKPEYELALLKKYFGGSNDKIKSINGQIPKAVMDDLLGLGKV
jgi:hypothetical protein